MRKIFLAIAILVIAASFLTGCAKEEALAGEAVKNKICFSVPDVDKETTLVLKKAVTPEEKALAGQAMGMGREIMLTAFAGDKCECQLECEYNFDTKSMDCEYDCSMC